MPDILSLESNNVVELQSLTNSITGELILDANVSVIIYDLYGNEVPGQIWPATMTHAGEGTYRATLEPTMELVENYQYKSRVVAIDQAGGQKSLAVPAESRMGMLKGESSWVYLVGRRYTRKN